MLGAARRLSEPNFVFEKSPLQIVYRKIEAAITGLPEAVRDQQIVATCEGLIGKNQLILAHKVALLISNSELQASVIASIRCDKK